MARKEIVIDDLTGRELSENDAIEHKVKYGDQTYVIETTKANADRLDKAIHAYLSGEKTLPDFAQRGGPQAARGPAGSGPLPRKVREWALNNNIEVPTRGRIPADVLEKYNAAH